MLEIIKPEDSGFERKRNTTDAMANYPLGQMDIMDSFFIPDDGSENFYKVIRGRIGYYNRKQKLSGEGRKCSLVCGEKDGVRGFLVTRVV